jgi:hypothetical protein
VLKDFAANGHNHQIVEYARPNRAEAQETYVNQ